MSAGLIPIALMLFAFVSVVLALTRMRSKPGPPPADHELVVLVDALGEANAQIMVGALEAAGVPAFPRRRSMLLRAGDYANGRHEVLVRYGDLADARRIIGLAAGYGYGDGYGDGDV